MDLTKDLDSARTLLAPAACYSSTTIRSFLRLSRKHSDDSLATSLPRRGSCAEYISNTLFPAWYARDYVIEYCEKVAENKPLPTQHLAAPDSPLPPQAKPPIDPRLDPYGARDEFKVESSPEDDIKSWVHSERMIEEIIRDNSSQFLANKCGNILFRTAERLTTEGPSSFLQAYQAFKNIYRD